LSLIGNGQAVFDDAELFINGDIGPADLTAARARKHASRGEWKKASAAYEELVAQRPQVSWFQVSLATLHVANNDLEAFHRQCQKLLNALSIQGQMDNNLPRTVAMTCALVPESKIDLDIPLKLASRALEEAFTPPESKQAHFTLSLIYYRKGDYEAARGHASKASEWEAPSHTQAMSLLVACMAQHQAGELENAKKTIEEADRIIAQVPALNTTTGDLWWPWLVIQILRNEAGQLVFEEGKTKKN
jgi:tetratricopeptide (TPR) repeat protein